MHLLVEECIKTRVFCDFGNAFLGVTKNTKQSTRLSCAVDLFQVGQW